MPPFLSDVTPRRRDAVRVDVARTGIESALLKINPVGYLHHLETDVALFDVHTDLEIASRHLENAADGLRRIAEALRA
jgi:hypothetical protein